MVMIKEMKNAVGNETSDEDKKSFIKTCPAQY